MQAYHITQWDTLYETAVTRKIRTLSFYGKPNKLVGEGIGLTLAQEDNVSLLGTWSLIEALASTAPHGLRGWLMRNGTALTSSRMGALTRVKAEHFERALDFFCLPEVAWLEFSDLPGESPGEKPTSTSNSSARESTGTNSPRESDYGSNRRETGERARSEIIPTVDEVKAWAMEHAVDTNFAEEKHMQHSTRRGGWMVQGQLIHRKSSGSAGGLAKFDGSGIRS